MTRLHYIGFCVFGVLAYSQAGYGQMFDRAVVLENVRILRGDGQILERATLIIKGDRVVEMGEDVKAPFWSSRHDLSGKTVTPGLIDAWSTLGLSWTSPDRAELSRAWDAFDPYAKEVLLESLRHGVTAVYITPGRSPGINGVGAVVRLTQNDDGSMGSLVQKDAALAISFGPAEAPIARLKTFEKVRKQFRDALDYRESLEDYAEELKEYLEKLETRRKEKDDDSKADGDEKAVEGEKKSPADADKDEESPKPTPKPDGDDDPASGSGLQGLSARSPFAGDGDSGKNGKGDTDIKDDKDKDKEEEELTKPAKPEVDRVSELLLEAIDHKLEVRILAQRSDGIINALSLAEEFNLDMKIEGATEAYLVASAIADADVGLIVGQVSRSGLFRPNQFRRYREGYVDALERASIAWTLSSGGLSELASRFVSFNAQLAASKTEHANWLSLVTSKAARLLGVSSRVGYVGVRRLADLVVWSADPSEAGAVVDRVYVSGKLVYDRHDDIHDQGGQ